MARDAGFDYLQTAARERMITAACARDLRKPLQRSGKPPGRFLIETGRLTPIQAEAIDGLTQPDEVAPGFEVTGLLGYGGIGIVFRARQPTLDRTVALKTISTARVVESQAGATSTTLPRFQQEAQMVAKLKHPNIVAAYDYGTTDSRVYLAMELVDGIDGESFIRKHLRLPEATTWQLVKQAAAALAHAADFGVIHRDIKPANLLLADPPAGYPLPEGVPVLKVTDFGLARLSNPKAEDEATRLTMTGATMGTPHYMAPEQIDDASVGPQADIYALGATAWHMIAGKPPLSHLSLMKVFAAKLAGEGPRQEELPDDVTGPSRELLADLLRAKPEDRPKGYREVLNRIDEVLNTLGPAEAVAPTLVLTPESLDQRTSARQAARPQTRGLKAWLLVGCLLLATLIGSLTFWPSNDARTESPFVESGKSIQLFASSIPRTLQGFRIPTPGNVEAWKVAAKYQLQATGRYKISNDAARFDDPEHYALQFDVLLGDGADAVDVQFDQTQDGNKRVCRVTRSQVSLGLRAGDFADFQPTSPATLFDPTEADATPVFLLQRDQGQWLLLRRVNGITEPELLARCKASAAPPAELSFRPLPAGAPVYIGELELLETQLKDATEE